MAKTDTSMVMMTSIILLQAASVVEVWVDRLLCLMQAVGRVSPMAEEVYLVGMDMEVMVMAEGTVEAMAGGQEGEATGVVVVEEEEEGAAVVVVVVVGMAAAGKNRFLTHMVRPLCVCPVLSHPLTLVLDTPAAAAEVDEALGSAAVAAV